MKKPKLPKALVLDRLFLTFKFTEYFLILLDSLDTALLFGDIKEENQKIAKDILNELKTIIPQLKHLEEMCRILYYKEGGK